MVFGDPPALRTLLLFGSLGGFCIVPEGLAAPYARLSAAEAGHRGVGLSLRGRGPARHGGRGGRLRRGVPPSARMRVMGWLAMASCAPLIGSAFSPPLWAVLRYGRGSGAGGAYQLAAAAAFVQTLAPEGGARAFGLAQSACWPVPGLGILADGAVAGFIESAARGGPRQACWAYARPPSSRWAGRCAPR